MFVRSVDGLLIVLFAIAAFVSLVYAPMFLLGCGWEGLKEGAAGACSQSWVGRAWLSYVEIEPIYADAPLWLRLLNTFDTFLFGWFYALSLVVFLRRRQDGAAYRTLATFMCGLMAYPMAFYLAWETLSYRDTGAQIIQVWLYNGLWLLIIVLLLSRLYLLRPRQA